MFHPENGPFSRYNVDESFKSTVVLLTGIFLTLNNNNFIVQNPFR
jgi:hypothetical protein